jgi:hypothetical protein
MSERDIAASIISTASKQKNAAFLPPSSAAPENASRLKFELST